MAFDHINLAEFMMMSEKADTILPNFGAMFTSELLPDKGYIDLPATPGFGLELDGAVLTRMSHKFEKRCEARQSEIRAGSVLAHVTKRIAAITPPRALVVLRFLLNSTKETDCFWPNPTTLCYLTNYIRSAETGEIFGLNLVRPFDRR